MSLQEILDRQARPETIPQQLPESDVTWQSDPEIIPDPFPQSVPEPEPEGYPDDQPVPGKSDG